MFIVHDTNRQRFVADVDGCKAYVDYTLHDGGLDIRHTVVPQEIGGRGVAAALVKTAYDYAVAQNLKVIATCSYAVVWLKRHPEYNGSPSADYCGEGTCAL